MMQRLVLLLLALVVTNLSSAYAQGTRGGAVSRGFTSGSQAFSSGAGVGLSQRSAIAQQRFQTSNRAHRAWRDHRVVPRARFSHRGLTRKHHPAVVVVRPRGVPPSVVITPLRPRVIPRHFVHTHRGLVIIGVPGIIGTGVVPHTRWPYFAETAVSPHPVRPPGQVAPFDPTPQEVVERMLGLAGVKEGDVVYDLGAGDGRIVVAAAKKYGVRAVGFEIDPGLVKLARERIRDEELEHLVEIRQENFLSADLSGATVVTLYLSQDGNLAVRPALMNQLKPGSRVVSYTFDMGDWPPKVTETYRDKTGDTHLLYLWQISDPAAYSEDASFSAEQGELSMIIDRAD